MRVSILGSGTSIGVPEIGCTCDVCTSKDARDKRLRCSGLVEVNDVRILIDCSPDFRQQMLALDDYRPIDAVLITHEHYDHVGGIDDLRAFCRFRNIPIFAEPATNTAIRQRIPYCFRENLYPGVPRITLANIVPGCPFTVQNLQGNSVSVLPFRVMHGKLPIVGYRIGRFAWITDMLTMPEESYELLADVEGLVINALRHKCHPAHQTVEQALENIARIAPRRAWLIHFCHDVGLHACEEAKLPTHVRLAYDGLQFSL
ncbi:MAG: MBL fold metallo-hydrolase [Bacteroidales bacterium]|nr:MBL fold metallo-hydrolase [Bacteroidales bacterium]